MNRTYQMECGSRGSNSGIRSGEPCGFGPKKRCRGTMEERCGSFSVSILFPYLIWIYTQVRWRRRDTQNGGGGGGGGGDRDSYCLVCCANSLRVILLDATSCSYKKNREQRTENRDESTQRKEKGKAGERERSG